MQPGTALQGVGTDSLTRLGWDTILERVGQIAVILVVASLAFWILRVLLRRVERSAAVADPATVSLHEQRVVTLVGLLRNVGTVVILVIALFQILETLGVPIGPLLAGAGVVGLAISFGAQSLVRDIITGLFILFENQFAVGDVIRIGDASGRVEKMTLRIVVLRDIQGTMHIIPNGEITRVSNLTRSFSRAVIDIGVGYNEDVDRVLEVLRALAEEFWNDPQWRPLLMEQPTIPGIESFGDTSVNLRMLATTLPLKQWDVARELRRRIKRRFDEEGIEIPFPHRTVHLSAAPPPGADG